MPRTKWNGSLGRGRWTPPQQQLGIQCVTVNRMSHKSWQPIEAQIREGVNDRLSEIGEDLLLQRLVPQVKPVPYLEIIFFDAKSYSGKIEIDQSADGRAVQRARFVYSTRYFAELFRNKQLKDLFRIQVAHLACSMYFPHDPCPGTFYWTKVMDALGYYRPITGIPHYPAVRCQRFKGRKL